MPAMLYLYSFLIVAAVAASLHIILARRPFPPGRVSGIFVVHLLFWTVGLAGILAFFGHSFEPQAAQIARQIGWPPGNPFQYEVGIANLAIGMIAILALWIRGTFWVAPVVAASIWGYGNGIGHLIQWLVKGNYSPGNAGAPLVLDFLIPTLLIIFGAIHWVRAGHTLRPDGS